ncbi:MAG TPA: DUF3570 domain-containing protein [Steroidobacteraceae bacterium]|nr:DUF3570 domain-containing protein [Steroidobacteraceae bacterium]
MQLGADTRGVRRRLVAATCALLTASATRSQATPRASIDEMLSDWRLDSALAYYHEDGRIQAIEPVVSVSRDFGDGETLDLNFTFDSLTGSSPNGALPSRKPQTFASPSGTSLMLAHHSYTTAPGELPVDPHYHDQRFALGADWTLPLTRLTRVTVGGKFSDEHDFLSVTADASIAHDFNDKNTTVSLGLFDENDSLSPIGGAPVPLSDYALFEKTGHKSKNGAGVLLSVTQVMTRTWLTEFNLSADRFTGYLNDPYKIISVIDDGGDTVGYVYENRPQSRTRRSAYLENRVGWERASAALSLRYMSDSWGVHSATAQLNLRQWNAERDKYLEPTARWYRQTAADFYTPWLLNSAGPDVTVASSDSRLGAFRALTYGLKFGMKLNDKFGRDDSELNLRVEYYQQTVESAVPGPGSLQGLDLYPSLKAVLLEIGFSY